MSWPPKVNVIKISDDHARLVPVRHNIEYFMECKRKQQYRTQVIADRVVKKIFDRSGDVLRAYPCTFCSGFHLTSKSKEIYEEQETKTKPQGSPEAQPDTAICGS